MLMLALIAAAASQPGFVPRSGAVVQASATIRIISGKRLTLGARVPEAELRQTSVRDIDGQTKPAQLIEFQ